MFKEIVEQISGVLNEHLAVKDEEGRVVLQVAQIATVYFADHYTREVKEGIASCCETYFRRWEHHLRWALDRETDRMERFGTTKGSDLRAWLPYVGEDERYSLIYHGAEDAKGASPYSIFALGPERRPYLTFGFLQMSLPLLDPAAGAGSLLERLLDTCRTLKPASGYGGIGAVDSVSFMTNYRYGPIVYHWAERFPGFEVDYPVSHSNWLTEGREPKRDGIKGVNWLTVVGDRYVGEMGGADKIVADLAALDGGFVVHRYDGGLLIQAGPRPELGDARRGLWPALYVKLAKYLKPIRVTKHKPFQRGGPSILFDKERSEAWLRRFDDR